MAFYRDRDLANLAKEVASDGIGIGGGFIVAGVVGRQVENLIVKTPVDETSTLLNKLLAWGANNTPKAALYLIAKKYDAGSPVTKEASKALLGSVVYDTVLRLANKGVNPANVMLGQYRILGDQNTLKLQQENSILRTELNKALRRLAEIPPSPRISDIPGYNPDMPGFKNAAVPNSDERQKRYGAMPVSPAVAERQREFGAMPFEQPPGRSSRQKEFGFAGTLGDSERLKVFDMQ